MLSYQTINEVPEGISIVGIGGAGANVLRHLAPTNLKGVKLFCTALDARLNELDNSIEFIQLGSNRHHGLGSGGDPSVAKTATLQNLDDLHDCVLGCKLVVLICGLGGGTGSGVAPVIAEMAELAGAMVAAVVVMPFEFEGERRRKQAELALSDIRAHANLVLSFENDEMEDLMDHYGSAKDLFNASAAIMAKAAACLPTIATSPGLINMGLDELQACLPPTTNCIFANAEASGEQRVEAVLDAALQSPMMKKSSLERMGSQILVHLTGDEELRLSEIQSLLRDLKARLPKQDVDIMFGVALNPELKGSLRLTLLAACSPASQEPKLADKSLTPPLPPAYDLELDVEAEAPQSLIPEPSNTVATFFDAPVPEPTPAPVPEPEPQPAPAPETEPRPPATSLFDFKPQQEEESFSLSQTPNATQKPIQEAQKERKEKTEKKLSVSNAMMSFMEMGSLFLSHQEEPSTPTQTEEQTQNPRTPEPKPEQEPQPSLEPEPSPSLSSTQAPSKAPTMPTSEPRPTSPYDEHPYPEPDYSDEFGDVLDTPPSMRSTDRPSWAQFD